MAAHACLKNKFAEDEKCQNVMSWLIYSLSYEAVFFFLVLSKVNFIKKKKFGKRTSDITFLVI